MAKTKNVLLKRVIKKKKITKETTLAPYEERTELRQMVLFVIIVNRHQGDFFLHLLRDLGVSTSFLLYGYSMPPEEILAVLGADNLKKDIVVAPLHYDLLEKVEEETMKRFKISRASKGVAFVLPIDAINGIAAYRFLSDHDQKIRELKNEK